MRKASLAHDLFAVEKYPPSRSIPAQFSAANANWAYYIE
jgi:hypothetical protein